MTGYTPIFSKIVDSSLWCEPDNVVKIFITLLAKKDADNVVRGNAFNISQWAKKTEQEVLEALKILSAPDNRRIEPQPFEGRRIERVGDGWLILNGKFYQDLMRAVNRRAYKAEHEAGRRARLKEENPEEEVAQKFKRLTLAECEVLAVACGMKNTDGEAFFDHYESNGWKVGRTSMKDPKATMRNWKRRSKDYGQNPSGTNRQPPQRVDRSVGTANEGKASQYKGLGKVPGT